MKIGCCTNMIANGADGTGIENIELLAEMGFDYIELPLAEISALSDSEFMRLVQRVNASGIRCEACNNFFPRTMRLTGYTVDLYEITGYIRHSLNRARALNVEYVVFGSGPAKNVPEGFPLDGGYRQVKELLQIISTFALRNGITIVIEPLRKAECNLINTFAEGCRLARDVNRENIAVLVDFYHLSEENEPLQHLLEEGPQYLRHVHIAAKKGRSYPSEKSADPFKDFFKVLRKIGYNRRISVEAYTNDLENDARATLQFLRSFIT